MTIKLDLLTVNLIIILNLTIYQPDENFTMTTIFKFVFADADGQEATSFPSNTSHLSRSDCVFSVLLFPSVCCRPDGVLRVNLRLSIL